VQKEAYFDQPWAVLRVGANKYLPAIDSKSIPTYLPDSQKFKEPIKELLILCQFICENHSSCGPSCLGCLLAWTLVLAPCFFSSPLWWVLSFYKVLEGFIIILSKN
jgi:hypothetical protein